MPTHLPPRPKMLDQLAHCRDAYSSNQVRHHMSARPLLNVRGIVFTGTLIGHESAFIGGLWLRVSSPTIQRPVTPVSGN